jgi:hypothetical protein
MRSHAEPSTFCLPISSAKYPTRPLRYFTFHRTLGHEYTLVKLFVILKEKITFPSVSKNTFQKHEAQSSNPSITKKRKKERKKSLL